ncbi:hypothetical protein RFI_25273, partial [Reticulomyxa filosa]
EGVSLEILMQSNFHDFQNLGLEINIQSVLQLLIILIVCILAASLSSVHLLKDFIHPVNAPPTTATKKNQERNSSTHYYLLLGECPNQRYSHSKAFVDSEVKPTLGSAQYKPSNILLEPFFFIKKNTYAHTYIYITLEKYLKRMNFFKKKGKGDKQEISNDEGFVDRVRVPLDTSGVLNCFLKNKKTNQKNKINKITEKLAKIE